MSSDSNSLLPQTTAYVSAIADGMGSAENSISSLGSGMGAEDDAPSLLMMLASGEAGGDDDILSPTSSSAALLPLSPTDAEMAAGDAANTIVEGSGEDGTSGGHSKSFSDDTAEEEREAAGDDGYFTAQMPGGGSLADEGAALIEGIAAAAAESAAARGSSSGSSPPSAFTDASALQLPDVEELRSLGIIADTNTPRGLSSSRSRSSAGSSGGGSSSATPRGSGSGGQHGILSGSTEGVPALSLMGDHSIANSSSAEEVEDDMTVYPFDELANSDDPSAAAEAERLRLAFESSAASALADYHSDVDADDAPQAVLSAENLSRLEAIHSRLQQQQQQHANAKNVPFFGQSPPLAPAAPAAAPVSGGFGDLSEITLDDDDYILPVMPSGALGSTTTNDEGGDDGDTDAVVDATTVGHSPHHKVSLSASLSPSEPRARSKTCSPPHQQPGSGGASPASHPHRHHSSSASAAAPDNSPHQQQQPPKPPQQPQRRRVTWEEGVTQGSRYVMSYRNVNRYTAPAGAGRTLPFVVPIKHVLESLWREDSAALRAAAAVAGGGSNEGSGAPADPAALQHLSVQQRMLLQQQQQQHGGGPAGGQQTTGGGASSSSVAPAAAAGGANGLMGATAHYQTVAREVSGDGTIHLRVQTLRPAPQFTDAARFKWLLFLAEERAREKEKEWGTQCKRWLADSTTASGADTTKEKEAVAGAEASAEEAASLESLWLRLVRRADVDFPTLLAEWPHVAAERERRRQQLEKGADTAATSANRQVASDFWARATDSAGNPINTSASSCVGDDAKSLPSAAPGLCGAPPVRSLVALLYPPRAPLIASDARERLGSFRAAQHRVHFGGAASALGGALPMGVAGHLPCAPLPLPSQFFARAATPNSGGNAKKGGAEEEGEAHMTVATVKEEEKANSDSIGKKRPRDEDGAGHQVDTSEDRRRSAPIGLGLLVV